MRKLFSIITLSILISSLFGNLVLAAGRIDATNDATTDEGEEILIEFRLDEPIIIPEEGEEGVTLEFTVNDPDDDARIELEADDLFIPTDEWNQVHELTVTVNDDAELNTDNEIEIDFLAVSDSEYYNNFAGSAEFTIVDDEAPISFDAPTNLALTDFDLGDDIAEDQPTFEFELIDDNEDAFAGFKIQIASGADFAELVVDYESDAELLGERSFTVGQAEGDGTYTLGEEDQTLEDGVYYARVYLIDTLGNESDPALFNDENVAFTVDTTAPVFTEVTQIPSLTSIRRAVYYFDVVEINGYEFILEENIGGADPLVNIEDSNISYDNLNAGSTYESTFHIVDDAGNESDSITVGPFTIRSSGGGSSLGRQKTNTDDSQIDSPSESAKQLSYEEEVEQVMLKGIITKNPAALTDKCEALTIFARVFNWTIDPNAQDSFSDTPAWCKPYAYAAAKRGVVVGKTADNLGLPDPVSRYEIAVMLMRELSLANYNFPEKPDAITFKDEQVDWAKEAVLKLATAGIIKGFADGTFGGEQGILKQDLAIMLLRSL